MGIFDIFKTKPAISDEAHAVLSKMAQQMFPNGYSDVVKGGNDIYSILNGKLSEEKCKKLFTSIKSLMIIANDTSKERIIKSIIMRGDGFITEPDAILIYRYLIDADPLNISARK